VYIEDTDAYGIMYNANYLRSYDRALHLTTTATSNNNNNNNSNSNLNTLMTSQHEGWSIVSMGLQKFSASPKLGGDFVVQATLKDSTDHLEVWDMQMNSPDGAIVYNTVKNLQIAKPKEELGNRFSLLQDVEAFWMDDATTPPTKLDTFTIYRDEIDAHWTGHLPLRNVLNLFERARSNFFGGPNNLARLQQEDGILSVVTSIGDCSLIDDHGVECYPGQQVTVETSIVVKRRGMVVECWQTLRTADESGESRRLAQGKVKLMMLDAKTNRPTYKLPSWVQEKLGLV
jgi:acyl-CoA thioesterase FadM